MRSFISLSFFATAVSLHLNNHDVVELGGFVIPQPVSEGGVPCSAVWNRSHVVGADGDHKCKFQDMNPKALDGAPPPHMCLREYPEAVSSGFAKHGYWQDCLLLADLWKSLPDRSSEHRVGDGMDSCKKGLQTQSKVYVDIGANIGTCLLQMIARSDVPHTIAFEPNPENQFYLTNSILATPGAPDKCSLYPHALGSASGEHVIYQEGANAGNTVLDHPVHMGKNSKPIGKVITYSLDDVLMKDGWSPYVHLLKIDAQGYEVQILKGASKLLSSGSVNAVKFELASEWLITQNTSSAEYINQYIKNGYDIYGVHNLQNPLKHETLRKFACARRVVVDLVAILKKAGHHGAETQIEC
jgi:FkbM family methyltransferase